MTHAQPLSAAERVSALRLIRTDGIGPATYRALMARFGSHARAISEVPALARRGGRARPHAIPSAAQIEDEMARADTIGIRFIVLGEPDYPRVLATLDPPPPVVSVRGNVHLLARDGVAVVGARNASAGGQRMARDLATGIAAQGLNVVSGMARGVDGAAHLGALAGGTIAVLAGGADVVYPPEHQSLYEAIVAQGLIVSEMALGQVPVAASFPRRNRIISGLSRGVVVVEAAVNSGSLITARHALEQGREVLAVPGSPLDPRSRGPNELIRQGATLVETIDDIMGVIRPIIGKRLEEPEATAPISAPGAAPAEDEVERWRASIRELLSPVGQEIDELIRLSGAPPGVVQTVLLELELAGLIERQPGQRVALNG